MPIDKLNDMIHEMENDPDFDPDMQSLLDMLREARTELSPDPTEQEVDDAIETCIRTHLLDGLLRADADDGLLEDEEDLSPIMAQADDPIDSDPSDPFSFDLDAMMRDIDRKIAELEAQEAAEKKAREEAKKDEAEEEDDFMAFLRKRMEEDEDKSDSKTKTLGDLLLGGLLKDETTDQLTEALKDHLNARDLKFARQDSGIGANIFQLGMSLDNCTVRLNLLVARRRLSFQTVLPISADPLYHLPLIRKMNEINDQSAIGTFCLDPNDNSVKLSYSYQPELPFSGETFDLLLAILMKHTEAHIGDLRRLAVGRMKKAERQKLIRDLKATIRDLEEDE